MTDRYRVYTKVKKTLKQMLKLDHQGHRDAGNDDCWNSVESQGTTI